MRLKPIVLLGFLATTGCAGGYEPPAPAPASTNVEPTNYRSDVGVALRNTLKDVTSVRDAWISRPFVRNMGVLERYVV
jgi:hypothetical protein